jgi:hypothetical protein
MRPWNPGSRKPRDLGHPALRNHARCAPALHSWIKIELEKVLECDDVDGGFVVGSKFLDSGRHHKMNPRLKHRFQVTLCNLLVYCCEEETKATSTLCHNLSPTFSQSSLDREDDRVRWILRKYSIEGSMKSGWPLMIG